MTRIDELTLDTILIREWWDRDAKHRVVEELLALRERGLVDLAVTATIREDIWFGPLAERLSSLPEVGITETGTVARLGRWVLDRDMLGDQGFADWYEGLHVEEPEWRDFDHPQAHMLLRRDLFLTWDEKVLEFSGTLDMEWGIHVIRPEEYLDQRQRGSTSHC